MAILVEGLAIIVKRYLIIMLLLLNASDSYAQEVQLPANELYSICQSELSNGKQATSCHFYMMGFLRGYQTGSIDNPDIPHACVPNGVTSQQLGDMLIKYLKDNPSERHQDIGILTFIVLAGFFPCDP